MFIGAPQVLAAETSSTAQPAVPLKLPYDPPSKIAPKYRTDIYCKAPNINGEPPYDLYFESRYDKSDPTRSKIDPQEQKEYRDKIKPITHFENYIIRMSNIYFLSKGTNKAPARCVMDWMVYWAKKHAMMGEENTGGTVIRHWVLASLGAAYMQIKDASFLDVNNKALVENWLRNLAIKTVTKYPFETDIIGKQNNHMYWAAWAVASIGIAIDNERLFEWSMNRARYVVRTHIDADGTLPYELKRGGKAVHYHQFAVIPLVMLAEAGLRNGYDLYEYREGILHRLVKRTLLGLNDVSYFEEITGMPQQGADKLHGNHFAWLEVYQSRFPSYIAKNILKKHRPVFSRRLGGDMTALYAVKKKYSSSLE